MTNYNAISYDPNSELFPTENLNSSTNHQHKCTAISKTDKSNIARLEKLGHINLVLNAETGKLE